MIFVNLRRLASCSQCDRLTPIVYPLPNAKQHGDERDQAQLCLPCERSIKRDVELAREVRDRAEMTHPMEGGFTC